MTYSSYCQKARKIFLWGFDGSSKGFDKNAQEKLDIFSSPGVLSLCGAPLSPDIVPVRLPGQSSAVACLNCDINAGMNAHTQFSEKRYFVLCLVLVERTRRFV